jgi:glucan phosphorylase
MRGGLYGKIKPLLLIRRIMEMQNGKTGDRRVVNTVQGLKEDFAWHLRYTLAKYDGKATPRDQYTAFAYAVRDRLVERWMETQERYHQQNERRVYYLSLEFLIGRLLGNNVINLKLDRECTEALKEALLRYCELDTMSMVFIWEYFHEMTGV